MKRASWLRRRFQLVKGRFENMFKRRDSAVVLDDAVDAVAAVAQHRAETEAKLEGKIEPLVPSSSAARNGPPLSRRRRASAACDSNASARDSLRDSRLSFVGQQFAISAVTAGCGQGLGWSAPQQQADIAAASAAAHEGGFHQDGGESNGRPVFPRSTKWRSRFRYSMLDPSMGLGEAAASHHHDDDAAFSEQANYIRVIMESGNFDLQQLSLHGASIDDPNFQTALHAALESFPPGMAAQIIEAAELYHDPEDELERPVSSLKKSRFSIAVASKTAWQDIRRASNRWSRVSPRRDSDIKMYRYTKPRLSRRVWSRLSFSGKQTGGYEAY
ncbi:hypothetical protein PFICI_14042 [Pestalotiopsis fici W106-1]|uniref:Uncharacterized protein n=1 Tax=Pestalotiopsis fici (strain W106-1 / CGMCC3.15140) TaxID=1229662 RepID=W3WMY5_PESFW|nr:uncharacterized protein PFICI_14042 [Pestalotiopsis fici W106-1]ETS74176.1 hypothetical protein PFICI_14042 [Pestalotiopsis fici W106-1]